MNVATNIWQGLVRLWKIRSVRRGVVIGLAIIGLLSGMIEIYNFLKPEEPAPPSRIDEIFGGEKQRREAIRALIEEEERAATEADRKRFAEAREKAQAGDTSEAEAIYREILFDNRQGDPEAKKRAADAAKNLGALLWSHDTDAAATAFEEATRLAPNDTAAWVDWGALLSVLGDLQRSESALEEGLRLAHLQGDAYQEMQATGNLGLVFQTRSDFGRSEELLRRAFNQAVALNDEVMAAWYAIRLGTTYIKAGLPTDAERILLLSLEQAQRLGERFLETTARVNLAGAYYDLGKLEMARETAEQTIVDALAIDDKGSLLTAYFHLGTIHDDKGELVEAETMYLKAIPLVESMGDKAGLASGLSKLGSVYRDMNRLDEAERKITTAVRMRRELGDTKGLIASLNQLGLTFVKQNRLQEAGEAYRESYDLAQRLGLSWDMGAAAGNAAKAYDLMGDAVNRCNALNDAVRNFADAKDKTSFDQVWKALNDLECPQRSNYSGPPLP